MRSTLEMEDGMDEAETRNSAVYMDMNYEDMERQHCEVLLTTRGRY